MQIRPHFLSYFYITSILNVYLQAMRDQPLKQPNLQYFCHSIRFDKNSDDDLNKIPARVKLFVTKYLELMGIHEGVASQTITNLSMSFSQDKTNGLITCLMKF